MATEVQARLGVAFESIAACATLAVEAVDDGDRLGLSSAIHLFVRELGALPAEVRHKIADAIADGEGA